jgi:arylsulfatase A-like enzyme
VPGRWWLALRSLAVPTVLFLAPIIAVQELRPLSFYLSLRDAAGEVALEILAALVLEAACAVVFALVFSALRALRLSNDRAEIDCAGMLTLGVAILCVLTMLESLKTTAGPFAGILVPAGLFLAAATAFTLAGWQRVFATVNRLNQSAQIVLLVCPLLLIPVLGAGIGWRGFDPPAAPGAAGSTAAAKPNVVLITFDALSAQDMSLYGYRLPTSPQFERLARRSYNFVNFFSAADFTTPAVASILTGQYSLSNRVFQLNGHIPARHRHDNLAWILKNHGYTTAAIVTNPAAHPLTLRLDDSFTSLPWPPMSPWFFPGTFLMQLRHSLLFNAVNHLMLDEILGNFGCFFGRFSHQRWVEPENVFASAETFIRGAHTPYMLWIHVYPPHAPYLGAAGFQGRFLPGTKFTTQAQYFWQTPMAQYPPAMQHEVDLLRLRYDENVADCDNALGQFLNWMSASHRDANTVLIVTSDHGENFSGGWWTHMSPDLRYAETHVPLLISLPGQSRGYTENEDGDLTDIAPTLLQILGIPAPSFMDGHALLGGAQADAGREPAFSLYLAESSPFNRPEVGAIAANLAPYHLVWYFPSGRIEFFDIAKDPEEAHYASGRAAMAMPLFADIQKRFAAALERAPQRKPR